MSHIWPRVRGSRPVVGSSRKISGGRVIRLAARSSRRRMPPENCAIGRSAASSRPNCSSSARGGRAGVAPRDSPAGGRRATGSRVAVRFSSTDAYWPVTPISWRTRAARGPRRRRRSRRRPAVDRQQRREHPQHRGLAGAVRAEDAEDLALAAPRGRCRRRRAGRRTSSPGRVPGRLCVCHLCHGRES